MSARTDRRNPAGDETGIAKVPAHRRGIETRRAIDKAATNLFFELGFHATTMKAIGTASNVQAAAIYHWYPNKEALLVHLQDEFMRELTETVEHAAAQHNRALYRLAAAVRKHVIFHALNQQEAFVTDSEIRALTPEPREDLIRKRDAYQQYFYDMIIAGMSEGDLNPVDPRVATYAILLQCTGVSFWFKSGGAMSADEVADTHVDLVLGSLHADPEVIAAVIVAVNQESPNGGAQVDY